MLKLRDALISWNPGTDEINVQSLAEHKEHSGQSDDPRYRFSGGAAFSEVQKFDQNTATKYCLCLFHTLIIRDKIDPAAAHAELVKIWEFAISINEECPGAIEAIVFQDQLSA